MDNIVTINNTKENVLDFDLSIQGLTTDDIRVWFCIKTGQMDLNFQCAKNGEGKWSVTVPKLPFIERTAYSCTVSVVADGYYFEPMVGTLNVTGSAEVYVKGTKNVTLGPAKEEEEETVVGVVAEPVVAAKPVAKPLADRPKSKPGERSIAQVAKDMLAKKYSAKADEPKKEEPKAATPPPKKEEPKAATAPPKKEEPKDDTPPKDPETGKFEKEEKKKKEDAVKEALANLKKKPVTEAVAAASVPVITPQRELSVGFRKTPKLAPRTEPKRANETVDLAAKILAEQKVTPAAEPVVVAKEVVPTEADKKVAAILEDVKSTTTDKPKTGSVKFRKKAS